MGPWFRRFKSYPMSILMHIFGWGAVGGAFLALPNYWPVGVIMLIGFVIYELASGVRHAFNDRRMDTVGLDCVDAVVGAVPAYCYVKFSILSGV